MASIARRLAAGSVLSVNGKKGDVSIKAADIPDLATAINVPLENILANSSLQAGSVLLANSLAYGAGTTVWANGPTIRINSPGVITVKAQAIAGSGSDNKTSWSVPITGRILVDGVVKASVYSSSSLALSSAVNVVVNAGSLVQGQAQGGASYTTTVFPSSQSAGAGGGNIYSSGAVGDNIKVQTV